MRISDWSSDVCSSDLVYVKDGASVVEGADQTAGYALVNGKRSVYLPIIKKADASTLDAVKNLKAAIPLLKSQLPEDVDIRYEFEIGRSSGRESVCQYV